jgi:hypothetical protein
MIHDPNIHEAGEITDLSVGSGTGALVVGFGVADNIHVAFKLPANNALNLIFVPSN